MCDSCELVYLKLYVLENANLWPISQICYFQVRLVTFFLTHVCPIFALNNVSEDDYNRSSDNKFGYVFAVHTICLLTIIICCIWENIYYKMKKIVSKVHEKKKIDTIVQHVIWTDEWRDLQRDMSKFTLVSYRTLALWGSLTKKLKNRAFTDNHDVSSPFVL